MKRTKAFSMIELLTVIAVIAILSGIILPVYARSKLSANRGADMSNMNALRSALQLYRMDQGGYPPCLLGYVTPYTNQPSGPVPASAVVGPLYPKRIESIERLRPIMEKSNPSHLTSVYWPVGDSRPLGVQLPHQVVDSVGVRQAFKYPDQVYVVPGDQNSGLVGFYKVSGYDAAEVKGPSGKHYELRYTLFWSQYALAQGGSSLDDPRQLGYSEPPGDTVITWNSYYRDYKSGSTEPEQQRSDIVLFLEGSAKPYDSRDLYHYAWRVTP